VRYVQTPSVFGDVRIRADRPRFGTPVLVAGVVAASGGNHGAVVAHAGDLHVGALALANLAFSRRVKWQQVNQIEFTHGWAGCSSATWMSAMETHSHPAADSP
jgi:hypothetical protein